MVGATVVVDIGGPNGTYTAEITPVSHRADHGCPDLAEGSLVNDSVPRSGANFFDLDAIRERAEYLTMHPTGPGWLQAPFDVLALLDEVDRLRDERDALRSDAAILDHIQSKCEHNVEVIELDEAQPRCSECWCVLDMGEASR